MVILEKRYRTESESLVGEGRCLPILDVFRTLGLKSRLSEIEIDDSNFDVMAAKAVRLGDLGNAFVLLDKNDVVNIFKMCL